MRRHGDDHCFSRTRRGDDLAKRRHSPARAGHLPLNLRSGIVCADLTARSGRRHRIGAQENKVAGPELRWRHSRRLRRDGLARQPRPRAEPGAGPGDAAGHRRLPGQGRRPDQRRVPSQRLPEAHSEYVLRRRRYRDQARRPAVARRHDGELRRVRPPRQLPARGNIWLPWHRRSHDPLRSPRALPGAVPESRPPRTGTRHGWTGTSHPALPPKSSAPARPPHPIQSARPGGHSASRQALPQSRADTAPARDRHPPQPLPVLSTAGSVTPADVT